MTNYHKTIENSNFKTSLQMLFKFMHVGLLEMVVKEETFVCFGKDFLWSYGIYKN